MKKVKRARIVFHGTNEKITAEQILKTGFNKHTYFAQHLEDAIGFGGKYVFYVAMKIYTDNWQIICDKKIPPSQIQQLVNFNSKELYYNENATKNIFPKVKSKIIPCKNCGADIGNVRLSVLGKPVVARCPKCKKRFN